MSLRERLSRPEGMLIAAVAAVVFAAFRLPGLTRYVPWTDEWMTITLLEYPFRAMLVFIADEQTTPPLVYMALRAWRMIGGDALWWLRLFTCVCGIMIAIPTVAICRRLRLDRSTTWLAAGLVGASQYLVYYSNELRSYSLFALLAAVSVATWLRLRDTGAARDVAALALVNGLLLNVHYFGAFVIVAEWLDAVATARHRLRAATLATLAAGVAAIPWTLAVVYRASLSGNVLRSASSIPRPDIPDVLDPYLHAIGRSSSLGLDVTIVTLVIAIVAIALVVRRAVRAHITVLALSAFVPAVLAIGISVASPRSFWIPRYLVATAVPFLILAAWSSVTLLPERLRRFAPALALWPAALTVAALIDGTEKVRYERLAAAIVATPAAPREVYVLNWYEGGPLTWVSEHRVTGLSVRHVQTVDSITASRGWLVYSEHHPPSGVPPAAALLRRGYRVGPAIYETGMYDDLIARRDSVVALPFSQVRAR